MPSPYYKYDEPRDKGIALVLIYDATHPTHPTMDDFGERIDENNLVVASDVSEMAYHNRTEKRDRSLTLSIHLNI